MKTSENKPMKISTTLCSLAMWFVILTRLCNFFVFCFSFENWFLIYNAFCINVCLSKLKCTFFYFSYFRFLYFLTRLNHFGLAFRYASITCFLNVHIQKFITDVYSLFSQTFMLFFLSLTIAIPWLCGLRCRGLLYI